MKDAVFSGLTVEEALKTASESLALPAGSFRYVVLDPGAPGGPNAGGTPARIAVLLDGKAPVSARTAPAADDELDEDFDPRSAVRSIVRAIAEAAGIDVSAEIEDGGATFKVRLLGPDTAFFLGRDGAVLRALEQLLQRMYGYDVEPQRVLVDCAGYRDQREEALREQARRLAAAVRKDGTPRTTEPMNSYERRIIHVALTGEAGVRTYSVGEGSNRRVTIALADDAPGRDEGSGEP